MYENCWTNKLRRCTGHDQRVYGRELAGSGASGLRRVVCACVRVVHGVAVQVYTVGVRVCGSVGEPCGLIGRDPARLTARSAVSGAARARSERGERMHDRGASGGVGACPVRWLGV